VARLVRQPGRPEGATARFPVRADATYLITGGLGGLGLAVARRLAQRGGRHLALVGRSAPGPAAMAAIEALRADGVHVDVAAADVADEAAARALLAELARKAPALGGIVHAAGVLDDAPLERQDAARVGRVFAPKAAGAWWLHRHSHGPAAPWLVFFSSASAVLESPGQAAYAAANAFLDGLARHLTHHGRAALSIGWGAWSGTGMAAARDAGVYRGMRLAPDDALGLLDVLMAGDGGHAVAMDFDPATWRARFPATARGPLLVELEPAAAPANAAGPSAHGNTPAGAPRLSVTAAPVAERLERLTELVRAEVCHVLRLQPERLGPHTPLGDVGMDSIMALEISSRLGDALGLSLSSTLPFSAPTLRALVSHIAGELGLPEQVAPATPAEQARDVVAIRRLDAHAAALQLQHELDETERLLGDG
jgi:NAD(P)-dependent dehydrogenase (short-subunit alcohol dehydrogenase family)/acyl carrier protein